MRRTRGLKKEKKAEKGKGHYIIRSFRTAETESVWPLATATQWNDDDSASRFQSRTVLSCGAAVRREKNKVNSLKNQQQHKKVDVWLDSSRVESNTEERQSINAKKTKKKQNNNQPIP
jgi:hypothetical protein